MSVTISRREKIVRSLFWAALVFTAAITVFSLFKDPEDSKQQALNASNTVATKAQIAQLEARLKSSPNDVQSLVQLGDVYLDARQAMDAFQLFQRAVKIEPDNVHALNDLGSIYQQIAEYDKALDSYRRAYESKPSHLSSLLNMALIYSQHKEEYDKALELLQTILDSNAEPQLIATAEQEITRINQVIRIRGNGSNTDSPASTYK